MDLELRNLKNFSEITIYNWKKIKIRRKKVSEKPLQISKQGKKSSFGIIFSSRLLLRRKFKDVFTILRRTYANLKESGL
jgi:hypothetical protein